VIPALATHLEVLQSSVPRIRDLFGAPPILVTPEPGLLAPLRVVAVADAEFATLGKADVRDRLPDAKKWLAGWYYQQILKYEIVLKSSATDVLILDADTVLLTTVPAPVDDEVSFPSSGESHAPYFRTFESLTGLRRTLPRSGIVNLMWFSKRRLRDLTEHIERHRAMDWRQAILRTSAEDHADCSFSEYETYANWCARQARTVTQRPFRLFRRGDLLVSRTRRVASVVAQAERRRYDAVTFEGALHRTTAARRWAANVLFAAGLCMNFRRYA
jgi:hypothetical protein